MAYMLPDSIEEYRQESPEEREVRLQKLQDAAGNDELDGKNLHELFDVCSAWFSRNSIDDLELSTRAYNCLSRYMDPPLIAPTGCHWTIDELLELTLGELKSIRNLGGDCCFEILVQLSGYVMYY